MHVKSKFQKTILCIVITAFSSCINAQDSLAYNNLFFQQEHSFGRVVLLPKTVKAFIFFSTECPICKKQASDIREIHSYFKQKGVAFYFVYHKLFQSKSKINKFHIANAFPLNNIVMDRDNKLTNILNASVTPECFLVDENGAVVYSGKINDRFESIGVQRNYISEHYLKESIESILLGKEVKIKCTKAVGCIINR